VIGDYRNQNEYQRWNKETGGYEYVLEEEYRPKLPAAIERQQYAPNIKDPDDENRIGELADEKVSAANLEIVFHFTKVSIADKTGQRRNDAGDGVGREDRRPQLAKHNCQVKLKDRDHETEVGQPTEVSAADDTGEDWRPIEQEHLG